MSPIEPVIDFQISKKKHLKFARNLSYPATTVTNVVRTEPLESKSIEILSPNKSFYNNVFLLPQSKNAFTHKLQALTTSFLCANKDN